MHNIWFLLKAEKPKCQKAKTIKLMLVSSENWEFWKGVGVKWS